jgi:hypothetical protein
MSMHSTARKVWMFRLSDHPVLEKIWISLGVLLLLATLVVTLARAAGATIIPRTDHLTGDQIACTLTNPEFTFNPGGAYMRIYQGTTQFAATHIAGKWWQAAYVTAGYNRSINSELCNRHTTIDGSHGRSYPVPAPLGRAGRYWGSTRTWTSPGYAGDTGYDIWLSGSERNNTEAKMVRQGAGTTEVMIWLSHPKLFTYHRYGAVRIDGRRWDVLLSVGGANTPGERWNRVFFISPVESTGTVSVHHLYLNPFLSYAGRTGYLRGSTYLMAIDEGLEFTRGWGVNEGYSLVRR